MSTAFIATAVAVVSVWVGSISPVLAQDFDQRWPGRPDTGAASPANNSVAPVEAEKAPAPVPAPPPAPAVTEPARPMDAYAASRQPARQHFSGRASYYAYSREKTASGEVFDRNRPTAAHRSLPFGTKVRVTNAANKKSVIVTITDRGPRSRSRVLDLSLSAARAIDMTGRGVARISADVL